MIDETPSQRSRRPPRHFRRAQKHGVRAVSTKMTGMLSSVLAAIGLISSPCTASAGAVPCETMLQELRSVQSSTSLDDPKRIAILELIMKGLERCTADDDRRADQFFSEALKLMQK